MGNICCCGKRKKTTFVTWSPETNRRKTEEDEVMGIMESVGGYGTEYRELELKPIIKY